MNNLWNYIQGLNLSSRNRKWLADKLVEVPKAKNDDPTLMSKEEFFARVEEASKGPTFELLEGETIEDLIKRVV